MARFSFAAIRPAFVPEWCAIILLALVETVWARVIGFHLVIGIVGLMTPPGLLLLIALLRGVGHERVALFFEYAALSLLGSFALIILSYLCMASSGALADKWLLASDRALGFDWLALYRRLAQHPALLRAMEWAYDSLLLQSFYITVFLGLRGQIPEMRALWRLSTIGCILCCLGAMAAPALGPFHDFGMDAKGIFLPAMKQLLGKQNLTFSASALTGVICFPSFHTVLALTCPWAVRRCGPLFFWSFAALNAAMLLTIPFLGGHYLTDMIAGAAVFAAALGIVKGLEWMPLTLRQAQGEATDKAPHAEPVEA